ncbi:metalloendoproteinase 5-MMP-like [Impatiens glandulifera]|uniref:metalloendoproteinase 5-MMP-like n=1 Tax=Impatiens glandulifera TaxID=253017 RepID=UPI001FB08DF3|nr:metalloendoproteinase 5-MMP-like [Impatiens glandulifera]XP_047309558.1 metalloendoproteinase 5-MMP-like [Impatiens glandulifera]XP_047309559.1 metalloendoproteinase 5-MMP-like [Impatiens glandulifera]
MEKAIKKFQQFFRLNVSGILDEKTLSLMVKPRCGFPDLVNECLIKHRGVKLVRDPYKSGLNYNMYGKPRWSKLRLSWTVAPGTRSDAINPITYALYSWQKVTKFNFIRSAAYRNTDIQISFTSYPSEDYEPFLQISEMIAYSYLPPKGKLHFRADIPWWNGAGRQAPWERDIETVAVHEMGHILGLMHSSDPSAVMWPYVKRGVTKRNLQHDDINAINALYNNFRY